jgi:predicted CopG family antitoxin
MHKELRRIAFREERSISDVVRELVTEGLEARKNRSAR